MLATLFHGRCPLRRPELPDLQRPGRGRSGGPRDWDRNVDSKRPGDSRLGRLRAAVRALHPGARRQRPELAADAFAEWCRAQRIGIGYIQPGKPDQNAFIERFNRTFREEVLDAYLFDSLEQVRELTDVWLATYNTERPHHSLGQVPPLTFLPRPDAPAKSTLEVST